MTGSEKRHAEINRLLEGMRPWLADDETLGIFINPPANDGDPHTMWVDTTTGFKCTDVLWKPMHILNLSRSIASEVGQQFDEEHPIMRGQLPDDGSHVTALGYPITQHGYALCLRKPLRVFTLEDYRKSGALDGPYSAPRHEEAPSHGHRNIIEYAIKKRWCGLIAGAPQSGNIRALNDLLHVTREQAPNRRLYVIEHGNQVKSEVLPANTLTAQPSATLGISDSDLLGLRKNVRPDGIILTELLHPQACYDFVASGMESSWTTICANSIQDALVACETLIEEHVPGITVSPGMIADAIKLIVHVDGSHIMDVAQVIRAYGRGDYQLQYIEPTEADQNARLTLQNTST